jgi:hypothetical protein
VRPIANRTDAYVRRSECSVRTWGWRAGGERVRYGCVRREQVVGAAGRCLVGWLQW